jgi:hypothetical protein
MGQAAVRMLPEEAGGTPASSQRGRVYAETGDGRLLGVYVRDALPCH